MDKLNKMDFIKTDFNENKYLIDKNKGIKRMVGLGEVGVSKTPNYFNQVVYKS